MKNFGGIIAIPENPYHVIYVQGIHEKVRLTYPDL